MICQVEGCDREAKYFMGWEEEDGKKFGYVCATDDRFLGRQNLINLAGMTLEEAIAFEKELRASDS